jgi:hypothetical protein
MESQAIAVALVRADWERIIALLIFAAMFVDEHNEAMQLMATSKLIEAQIRPVVASERAPGGD